MKFKNFLIRLLWAAGVGISAASWSGFEEGFETPPDMFGGPREGAKAPNFSLQTFEGQTADLQDSLKQGPVVLEFGSYTCPIFRQKHPGVEKLREKFGDRISFFTVYTLEAHPKGDRCPYVGREWVTPDNEKSGILYRQPVNDAQRKALAEKARSAMPIQTTLVFDDMRNSTWRAYGGAPNAAYLIGQDGTIKLRQGWFEFKELEEAIKRELAKRDAVP